MTKKLGFETIIVNCNPETVSIVCMGLGGEREIEEELMGRYDAYALGSTVFKASHHGSSTSNTLEFLRAVDPEIVVISLGADNTYGHPHAGPLKNFAAVGAEILRTDELGSVVIASDGSEVANLTRDKE